MAGDLVNALSAMGMHKDIINEVVDRFEPLSCEIADHPTTAWCSAASRMPIILAGCLRGFRRYSATREPQITAPVLVLVLRILNAPHQQGVREFPWRSHILWSRRRYVVTGYVLDSSGYGLAACRVAGALAPSSRFQQRDEGVPRRPGGPPHLSYCQSNYLSEAHTQHVVIRCANSRTPGHASKREFPGALPQQHHREAVGTQVASETTALNHHRSHAAGP